jgi:hypothetical protein
MRTYGRYKQFLRGLIAILLLCSGCTKPGLDRDHDIHTVAMAMPSLSLDPRLRDVIPGTEVELYTNEPRLGKMWKGCLQAADPFLLVPTVCALASPFVSVKDAIDQHKRDHGAEERLRQSLSEALPSEAQLDYLFKRLLIDYGAEKGHYSFQPVPVEDIEQEQHYEHLLRNGMDAVLETEYIRVILIGKNVNSRFRLKVCALLHLISTRTEELVFSKRICINSERCTIEEWSGDHWSRLQEQTADGLRQIAKRLIDRLFVIRETTLPEAMPASDFRSRRNEKWTE